MSEGASRLLTCSQVAANPAATQRLDTLRETSRAKELGFDFSTQPTLLHASASIFETMAKDVVDIQTVQDQTLKSFFDRYRKNSTLPDAILDYILAVYEARNVTPLAGHGSTQLPNLSREQAVTLTEMTKAFVRIEYRLRAKQ
jgi:hypothetical protein